MRYCEYADIVDPFLFFQQHSSSAAENNRGQTTLNIIVDWMGNRNIQYVTDAQGTILVRDEITGIEGPNYRYNSAAFNPGSVANKVTRYYYVDGKRVEDVSNDGAWDVKVDYSKP